MLFYPVELIFNTDGADSVPVLIDYTEHFSVSKYV